jgi:hypothetical protein
VIRASTTTSAGPADASTAGRERLSATTCGAWLSTSAPLRAGRAIVSPNAATRPAATSPTVHRLRLAIAGPIGEGDVLLTIYCHFLAI